MTPASLQPEHFQAYPPEARKLAVNHIQLLRRLPIGFLPLLLREVIGYDHKFPIERKELEHQLSYLEAMTAEQLQLAMRAFAQLKIAPELERLDWVSTPAEFSEKLTAHLWGTRQVDAFSAAAVKYVENLNATQPDEPPAVHRLGIVMVGRGVGATDYRPFRKLRQHGVHYKAVDSKDGYHTILKAVTARAARFPEPYAHWHIDGDALENVSSALTFVSYASLRPVRAQLQAYIQKAYETGTGSEALRSALARMRPEEVGLQSVGDRAALSHFQLSLLTEGSGTQIFSTTFVQWAAREVWRRAQPMTLFARFTPRQREDSTRVMLLESRRTPPLDPEGSLVDADMGAYYTWINQQRLKGAAQARFLAWFEGHNEALAIAPHLPKGTMSAASISLDRLLADVV